MKPIPSFLSLIILMLGCEQQTTPKNNRLNQLAQYDKSYQLPSADYAITFPHDHYPHKAYRHEWWYLTANLTTTDGASMAAQYTLFRTAKNQRHWYFAHGALADTTAHFSALRSGRQVFGNVEFNTSPFQARIDDWVWSSSADLLPATLGFGDNKQSDQTWRVELSLADDTPGSGSGFFLQGDNGFSSKHPSLNIASHYYSQPFITVTGRVLWRGKWQKVTGNAWFDREWGSQMLASDQQGWDWLSLRLNQNTALMIYRIRSKIEDYLYGSLMSRDGNIQILASDEIKLTSTVSATGRYPSGFKVAVKSQGIDINVTTINDQQINRFGIEYFEGMVIFNGSHRGKGFVEMTGYH